MTIPSIEEIDIREKRVLIRVDFDIPITRSGKVSDVSKILHALPTIHYAVGEKARVIIASHLSGPGGRLNRKYSLEPVGKKLTEFLDCEIYFPENSVGDVVKKISGDMLPGSVMLLENLEFHKGELSNSPEYAKKLSEIADIYVNEAFSISNQERASLTAITEYFDTVCAGLGFKNEINNLSRFKDPDPPFTAVIGGESSSRKIELMESLLDRVESFLVGGAIANSFLRIIGKETGRSEIDERTLYSAKKLISSSFTRDIKLIIPEDLVTVRGDLNNDSPSFIISGVSIPKESMAVDIGPDTRVSFANNVSRARTVLWNGPLGVYEKSVFGEGTAALAEALSGSEAFSAILGDDTVKAVEEAGYEGGISFISRGGDAAMDYIINGTIPAITAIEERIK
ncbi:MAG: phosphoglycerate kinase [Deltaproteobacteria bacterium]